MPQLSILVVEDEALIRMMLVEMLEELGHRVVAEAGSIEAAWPLAETATFNVAVLDVNVGGGKIDPIAEIVSRRKLPIVFATGYAGSSLPSEFIDCQHLQKPYTLDKLRQTIDLAVSAGAADASLR